VPRPTTKGFLPPLLGLLTLAAATGRAQAPAAPGGALVFVLDDETRVRRADGALARARGRAVSPAGDLPLVALRGETVAFQIVVAAGSTPIESAAVSLPELVPADGSAPGQRRVRAETFREHYLTVTKRSRNRHRTRESLGWEPEARADDADMTGDVPDALIPTGIDAKPVLPPPAVPAGQTAAFWIDLFVPETLPAGDYAAEAQVTGDGALLARVALKLTVRAPVLPYRANGTFMFYEAERLDKRLGNGDAVERQLWQLLHAHHIDALAQLNRDTDIKRLRAAYDGSLFREAAGYVGPGVGLPPSVVSFGTYGTLGGPKDESLGRIDDMDKALPQGIDDVFLYAVDEQCRSTYGADWKEALAKRPAGKRVRVGQTCDKPPETQEVDIAMIPGQAFGRAAPAAARAAGRRAWIYNGQLPRSGTLLLDADPRGLIANGWISAAFGIERWFYWESVFWDDDNSGGRGRIDPFTDTETFHNDEGDVALLDGLLLYPGRQEGKFAAHSLGFAGVLPSLRLKAIRRGIQDAALIALAARERPDEVRRIVMDRIPRALDEAPPVEKAAWDRPDGSFAEARAALRALVTNAAPLPAAQARASFDALAAARPAVVDVAMTRRQYKIRRLAIKAGAAMAAGLVGLALLVRLFRRRRA
jgi:hypothetical protein